LRSSDLGANFVDGVKPVLDLFHLTGRVQCPLGSSRSMDRRRKAARMLHPAAAGAITWHGFAEAIFEEAPAF
jgi:hypothetical protein